MPEEPKDNFEQSADIPVAHIDDAPQQQTDHVPFEAQTHAPVPVSVPVQAPVQSTDQPFATAPSGSHPTPQNPITLVLQWLTYAFWGWTVLSLSLLTTLSVGHFVGSSIYAEIGSSLISYALAAVIVLFIISSICDYIYSKREPLHKQGPSTVIMIIHAVIFALFAIGWVIAAVFAVLNVVLGSEDGNEAALTTLITGVIVSAIYGVTLVRTVRPQRPKRIGVYYTLFMALITLAIAALGIAGPAMNARLTKDDRIIEQGLSGVSSAINEYARENNALPQSLADVADETESSAKELLDRGMVEYKPGSQVAQRQSDVFSNNRLPKESTDTVFTYELCVTYKGEKGSDYSYDDAYGSERQTSPDTYYHDAGRVCYDLATDYIY